MGEGHTLTMVAASMYQNRKEGVQMKYPTYRQLFLKIEGKRCLEHVISFGGNFGASQLWIQSTVHVRPL
jgi:hypothetical protein